MIWSAVISPSPSRHRGGAELRREERLATETISCALGSVVDLSASGMRVVGSDKPPLQIGQSAQLRLIFPRGNLVVRVQARWLKRRGPLGGAIRPRYEMGFAFLDLTAAEKRALGSLARFGFVASAGVKAASPRGKPRVKAAAILPDYYAALGLEPGATTQEIRAAYRDLARLYHPDTTTDPEGEAKFMRVREAYRVLVDAEQRSSYDLQWQA